MRGIDADTEVDYRVGERRLAALTRGGYMLHGNDPILVFLDKHELSALIIRSNVDGECRIQLINEGDECFIWGWSSRMSNHGMVIRSANVDCDVWARGNAAVDFSQNIGFWS